MSGVLDAVSDLYARNPHLYDRIALTAAAVLAAWLARTIVLVVVRRTSDDLRVHYGWRKITTYVAFVVCVLVAAHIWLSGLTQLGTFLGLASAGVAIALKDPLTNIAGWLFIILRQPFAVGDRIEIGDNRGDVIDIRIFQFSLMEIGGWVDADQSTGRIVHVPNSSVFSASLANYTRDFPFIWNEVAVLVTFESQWRAGREILSEVCGRHCAQFAAEARAYLEHTTRKWFIVFSKLDPIVYTSVRDSGVLLTARFLCPPRQRRSTEDAIWSDVLDAFAERDDLDFAYPTMRYYDNAAEGKEGTRPG